MKGRQRLITHQSRIEVMKIARQAYQCDLDTPEGVTIDSARIIFPHVINTLAALVNAIDYTRIINVTEGGYDGISLYALDELEEIGLIEIIDWPVEGAWPQRPVIVKVH